MNLASFWDRHWWKILAAGIFLGMLAIISLDPASRYFGSEEDSSSDVNISGGVQDSTEETGSEVEDNLGRDSVERDSASESEIKIYHNGTGPMCLDAIEFFEQEGYEYEEFLTTEDDFYSNINKVKAEFNGESEGVSKSFGYYPVIVVDGRVFSGFDDSVAAEIIEMVENL